MKKHFYISHCQNLFEHLKKHNSSNVANDNALDFKSLNFFDTPEQTAKDLAFLTSAIDAGFTTILSDEVCNDVIPYILIDTLARGANSSCLPIDVSSRRVAKAVARLELSYLGSYCDEVDAADVWPFPVVFGRSHIRGLDNDEIVKEIWCGANGYIETLNKWLEQHSCRMVPGFRAQMESLITEVIGNSDHAVTKNLDDEEGGDWALTGYMVKREDNGEAEYICYMSLITLGRTVFESLSESKNEWVKNYIEKYVEHANDKIRLSEEALVTAAATHDQVSCRIAGGGNGLTDFLHGFTSAAAAEHKDLSAFVISGSGHVRFCGPYSRTQKTAEGRIRQTFNSKDSIYQPPDPNHVYHSDIHFPGTIIGVRFYLDTGDLIAKIERDRDNDNENHNETS